MIPRLWGQCASLFVNILSFQSVKSQKESRQILPSHGCLRDTMTSHVNALIKGVIDCCRGSCYDGCCESGPNGTASPRQLDDSSSSRSLDQHPPARTRRFRSAGFFEAG